MDVYERLRETWGAEDGVPFLIDIGAHGEVVTVCSPEHSHELDRLGSMLAFIMPNALEVNLRSRRDRRQKEIYAWVVATFGKENAVITERVLRLFEEVVELAQAEAVPPVALHGLISHVYGKAPGKPEQEAGGIGTTLLAYCAARGFSADDAEAAEAARVLAIDPQYFRERHNKKAAAGVAAFVKTPKGK
jgi:hypothetical protein